MDINITFVIQGINFGICYLFLKYFFLKPAIQFLNEREGEYNKLLSDLEKDELALQKKITYKESLIQTFRLQIKVQYPAPEVVPVMHHAYPVTYRQSSQATAACHEAITKLIRVKASDAR